MRSIAAGLCFGLASVAGAQQTGQDVFLQVDASNRISVAGATSVQVNSTSRASWAVTTNEQGVKVTLSLNAPLPSGVTLLVSLTPPAGARSAGAKPLTTSGVDLVTGISKLYAPRLGVTYKLDAAPQAKLTPTSRTVTYTIMGGA